MRSNGRMILAFAILTGVSLLPFVPAHADEPSMNGIFHVKLTPTKDTGGAFSDKNWTRQYIDLVCHQDGVNVKCVTPASSAGQFTWTGTFTGGQGGQLLLAWEDSGEYIRLVGQNENPGYVTHSFKGIVTSRYRQFLFWYTMEGVWSGYVN